MSIGFVSSLAIRHTHRTEKGKLTLSRVTLNCSLIVFANHERMNLFEEGKSRWLRSQKVEPPRVLRIWWPSPCSLIVPTDWHLGREVMGVFLVVLFSKSLHKRCEGSNRLMLGVVIRFWLYGCDFEHFLYFLFVLWLVFIIRNCVNDVSTRIIQKMCLWFVWD